MSGTYVFPPHPSTNLPVRYEDPPAPRGNYGRRVWDVPGVRRVGTKPQVQTGSARSRTRDCATVDVTDQLAVGARHSPHAQGPAADKRGAYGPPVRPGGLGMMGLAPFRNFPFSRLAEAFGHSDWADCWGIQTSPLRNLEVREDRKEEGST